jgi:hypothetical protein
MTTIKGITKSEILEKIPALKKGSFQNYLHQAHIDEIGLKQVGYNMAKVYPVDSVDRIKEVMPKK